MEKIAPNIVIDIKLKSQFCYVNTVEDQQFPVFLYEVHNYH